MEPENETTFRVEFMPGTDKEARQALAAKIQSRLSALPEVQEAEVNVDSPMSIDTQTFLTGLVVTGIALKEAQKALKNLREFIEEWENLSKTQTVKAIFVAVGKKFVPLSDFLSGGDKE